MHKLSQRLRLNPEINVALAELALDKYNSDSVDQQKIRSTVILSAKKLIHVIFEDFPVEVLDDVLEVVINMNPKPLSEICTKLGIPKELLELLIAFITNNEANIQNCIANLIDKIMPNEISELMLSLHNLIFGNITKDLKPIAKIFSVEYTLLIEVVIAIYRNDNNLTRYTIFSVIDRLAEKSKCEQLVEGVNIFKNRVMALSTLSMGSDLDIVSMVKISLPYFPSQKIQRLYEASKGDIGSIKHIIGNLCNCQVKVVMEICNLFLEDNFKANKIARHLGLEPEQAHVLTAYICLVIDCQKYSAKISSRPKNSADFSETFIIKEKEKFSARYLLLIYL